MSKKISILLASLLICSSLMAQGLIGGVKGTVVSRAGRVPVEGASLVITKGGEKIAEAVSDGEGKFLIEGLENGMYDMTVSADDFADAHVNVTVDQGFIKDLVFVSLVPQQQINDIDDSSFMEFDMDDSGYTDTPTILFGTNDVYNDVVGYGWSNIRFKNRGYNSETQDVYLSGIKLNDAITGYSPYSLWTGLNEAMRSKESTMGVEFYPLALGGYNGVTNILANPTNIRKGWRFSVLSNSALYRLRLMGTYASGEMDNGWSYAVNVSARLGGNDWVEGVYYRNFAYYVGVEKNIGDIHRFTLMSFATPGQRGAQNASTQEVYDLMGDNMYNSNWGYQNGKVRNARVRKTFEPVTVVKYTFTPSTDLEVNATALWRTGKNGYTALDWYDAQDPRPDYYRNLPSYFFMEDEDYNRSNEDKAEWATEAWKEHSKDYANYQHINWDRLYNVNYNSPDGRSKYIVEERRVDQNDINFAATANWLKSDRFSLNGGLSYRFNSSENFKVVDDLLGGEYYLNVDQFAERDFAADEAKIQNDLEYYNAHGQAQVLHKGDKYGYDYMAEIRNAEGWVSGVYTTGRFFVKAGGSIGYNTFWREGLYQKGLFPNDSKGKSEVSRFLTYRAKLGLVYDFQGGHRISANAGYFNDAPTFNQAFVSPRTRNTIVPNLTTVKTTSADINYQYSNGGWDWRITGFFTAIKDQTDVMSFYDDSQHSFTNFAMSGIDQRHMGIEAGIRIPTPIDGFNITGVVSYGEYIYTSNPYMTQTMDNSAEVIVDNQEIPYWKSHPIYKRLSNGDYDMDGNGYITEGEQKHYVPSTPQLAADLGLNYKTNSYWFLELHAQYFDKSYLDMNPLYRTNLACGGTDGVVTPAEVEYMASQEKFPAVYLINGSVGKSWYIDRKYQFGFSLELNNVLNNKNVKTGGYEQTRLINSVGKDRYYRFDSKYFYMQGANYMLNLYFKF